MSAAHTPGPHRFERGSWPFNARILAADGGVLLSEPADAIASSQHTLQDFNSGVGFQPEDRDEAIRANEQQAANFTLWAAAADLKVALEAVMDGCEFKVIDGDADFHIVSMPKRAALHQARAALAKAEVLAA